MAVSESKWLAVTWWTGTQKDALGRTMADLFKLVKESDPKMLTDKIEVWLLMSYHCEPGALPREGSFYEVERPNSACCKDKFEDSQSPIQLHDTCFK